MKKTVLTFVLGLFITIGAMAQSKTESRAIKMANESVEKIDKEIKLTEDEKVKYFEIQKTKLTNHFEIVSEFKTSNPTKFKEKVKINGQVYVKQLLETFGNKRGREILNASRK